MREPVVVARTKVVREMMIVNSQEMVMKLDVRKEEDDDDVEVKIYDDGEDRRRIYSKDAYAYVKSEERGAKSEEWR